MDKYPAFLSSYTAWILSAFFASSYVGSLYIFPAGRLKFNAERVEVGRDAERARSLNERWRNDPATIQARLAGVTLSTVLSCLVIFAVVTKLGSWKVHSDAVQYTLHLLGITVSGIPKGSWFLAPLMYLGSFYVQLLDQELPLQKHWSLKAAVAPIFTSWLGFRNIIAAPITEELVYRSCVIAAMKLAKASNFSMIFLSPLWFGAAHLHHGWDLFNRFGKTKSALKRAVMAVVFQQLYTSLFGFFEVFLLLRTGSILPCIFAHSFCNLYGIPLPMDGMSRFPNHKIGEERPGSCSSLTISSDIIIAHLIGLVAFVFFIDSWTRV
ncbi:hypothetical protein M408DRAFT_77114 [Serendipita vermifera MAFF 305830]|uniref:intramembrane prenyl-peptidase Rce1 n=1 Tax=Serendipita vermifera MAFF 305830 TaxID=933852 RepID=A0A0C2WBE2_SERVB|nr:hypothetical protein M408DRAFT_77114 [Serendipita vermifera MAFF 305830]